MSEYHRIVNIFVASPSGLDPERKAIRQVVDETNRRNSSYWQLQFKPVGWEDTVGGNRRAQDIINRDLETCDYFFGVMADHWGSPPHYQQGAASAYTSGFHEEYELAQKMYEAGSMRDIFLFFKDIPQDRLRDVGPSLQQVLAFRQKVRDEKKPLYTEFDTLDVFKSKIGDALSKIGWETTKPAATKNISAPGEENLEDTTLAAAPTSDAGEYFLASETRRFLADVINRKGDRNVVSNVDLARMRLIATGLSRVVNDIRAPLKILLFRALSI